MVARAGRGPRDWRGTSRETEDVCVEQEVWVVRQTFSYFCRKKGILHSFCYFSSIRAHTHRNPYSRIENNAPTPPEKAPLIQGTPPRIDGYFYAIYRAAKNHGRASIKSGT